MGMLGAGLPAARGAPPRPAPGLPCTGCGGGGAASAAASSSTTHYSEPDFFCGACVRVRGAALRMGAADGATLTRMARRGHPLADGPGAVATLAGAVAGRGG